MTTKHPDMRAPKPPRARFIRRVRSSTFDLPNMPGGRHPNQVLKHRPRHVPKKSKPRDEADSSRANARHLHHVAKSGLVPKTYPRPSPRNMEDVINESARDTEARLWRLEALRDPRACMSPRLGGAPAKATALLVLMTVHFAAGTAAEIDLRPKFRRMFGSVPPRDKGPKQQTESEKSDGEHPYGLSTPQDGVPHLSAVEHDVKPARESLGGPGSLLQEDRSIDGDSVRVERSADATAEPRRLQGGSRRVYHVKVRHRHRGDAHEHDQSITVYEYHLNPTLTDVIQSSSFEDIIAAELQRRNIDPSQKFEVRFARFSSLQEYKKQLHSIQTEWWSANEIAMYLCTARVTWWLRGASHEAKRFIHLLKQSDDLGRDAIRHAEHKHIAAVEDKLETAAENLAGKFGFDLFDARGSFKSIHASPPGKKHMQYSLPIPNQLDYTGDLAIVFETRKDERLRRFVIDLNSDPLIHEVSTDGHTFQGWMANTGKHLAFKDISALPDNATFSLRDHDGGNHHHFNFGVGKFLVTPMIRKITETFSQLIGRETLLEEAAHLVLGLTVPGWDALHALQQGNINQALIFAGLEIIPFIGKAGKIYVKVLLTGVDVGTKTTRTLAFAAHTTSFLYEQGKTVYGAHGTIREWANDMAP